MAPATAAAADADLQALLADHLHTAWAAAAAPCAPALLTYLALVLSAPTPAAPRLCDTASAVRADLISRVNALVTAQPAVLQAPLLPADAHALAVLAQLAAQPSFDPSAEPVRRWNGGRAVRRSALTLGPVAGLGVALNGGRRSRWPCCA